MAYGLSPRAPAAMSLPQRVRTSGPESGYQAWRQLDPEQRLELIDSALAAPANDLVDGFPLAL